MRFFYFFCILIFTALPTKAVDFIEILNDPDNIDLNEKFAMERISKGDYPAALSAIERVLHVAPTNTPLRLLRAELLVNLGNDKLAENELNTLDKLPLSENQRNQIRNLLNQIKDRGTLTKNTIDISFSLIGSDNANTYPESGNLEFIGSDGVTRAYNTYTSFGGVEKKSTNTAKQISIGYTNTYDLKNQNEDTLVTNITSKIAADSQDDYLNSKSTSFLLGANFKRFNVLITPRVSYAKMTGDTSADLDVKTLNLGLSKKLSPRLNGSMRVSRSILEYTNDDNFTTAKQGDGTSRNITTSFDYAIQNNLIGSVSFSKGDFEADSGQFVSGSTNYQRSISNNKDTESSIASLSFFPDSDSRVQISYNRSYAEHKNQDVTARKIRDDDKTTTSINYFINGAAINSELLGWKFYASFSDTKNNSNISQFDFERKDFSLQATYSFDL